MTPEKRIQQLKQTIDLKLTGLKSTLGQDTQLKEAVSYSLCSSGKRIRPIIVLLIAEALGGYCDVTPAALSVEFFHTASLIADDLPCMDNDALRRDQASLHKVYGESVAILASYTLIAMGYEYLHKNAVQLQQAGSDGEKRGLTALHTVTKAAGIFGATTGQFFDLYPPNKDSATIEQTIYQKTVTLFEITFVYGWVFGGGDLSCLQTVYQLAYHLGMAFQLADDLQDIQNSESLEGAN